MKYDYSHKYTLYHPTQRLFYFVYRCAGRNIVYLYERLNTKGWMS